MIRAWLAPFAALLLLGSFGAARAQAPYAAMVAASPNVQHYWGMSANANDSVGTANGTATGGVTFGATITAHVQGYSLNTATTAYVTLPVQYVPPPSSGSSWAWEFLFKQPNGNTAGANLFQAQQTGNQNVYMGVNGSVSGGVCGATGDAYFQSGGAGGVLFVGCSTAPVNDGNPHYYVISCIASTLVCTLYIDTVAQANGAFNWAASFGPAAAPVLTGNAWSPATADTSPAVFGGVAQYLLPGSPSVAAISAATMTAHYNCAISGVCGGGGPKSGGGAIVQ
jgi:hypothetical protein